MDLRVVSRAVSGAHPAMASPPCSSRWHKHNCRNMNMTQGTISPAVFPTRRAAVGGSSGIPNCQESELQGADPIGYACVKRSKQSKITCEGRA
eukprot:364794-Chlamydomonas_euryale.AAC.4